MTALLPLGYAPAGLGPIAQGLGGLYLPAGCLDRFWSSPTSGVKNICVLGDSVPQGSFTLVGGAAQGGMDCWPTRLARALQQALGPCVGAGIVGVWRSANILGYNNSGSEWSTAGSAPTQLLNNAFTLAPFGSSFSCASGAANQLICTPQTITNPRVVADAQTTVGSPTVQSATAAFTLAGDKGARIYGTNIPRDAFVIDVPDASHVTMNVNATGTGTAQVLGVLGRNPVLGGIAQVDVYWPDGLGFITQTSTSIDGGGTWQNTAAPTNPTPVVMRKTSLAAANPTSIRTRGANAAGTAQSGNNLAAMVLLNTATPTTGFMVHSFACDGNSLNAGASNIGFLGSFGSAGDPLLLLDNAGKSASQSLQPSLLIVNFSNDCAFTPAQNQADLANLLARVSGYCDVMVVGPQDQNRAILGQTTAQAFAYRAALKQFCLANGCAYLDLYEAFKQLGYDGVAQTAAANLTLSDNLHLSAKGHFMVGSLVARALYAAAG